MGLILISSGLLLSLLGSIFFIAYLKHLYRKYDERETLKEEIKEYAVKIKSALVYFHDTYCDEFDNTIYENIRIKTNFLKNIIDNIDDLNVKVKYYKKLFAILYEVGYRLKTNKENVNGILGPMNSLRNEIVHYKLDYIKENIIID